jgi:16S rRNA (guanine966-N2)-methyltransferase
LRIIGGTIRGRRILAPGKKADREGIRPTSARAREAVFNIIGPAVRDAWVLDLFAGTGAMGLEALSRGARWAVFIDNSLGAVSLIKRNVALCGLADRTTVMRRDLTRNLIFLREWTPPAGFSLVFVDPPYSQGNGTVVLKALAVADIVTANGLVILEHGAGGQVPETVGRLQLFDQRRYGEAGFGFYHCREG